MSFYENYVFFRFYPINYVLFLPQVCFSVALKQSLIPHPSSFIPHPSSTPWTCFLTITPLWESMILKYFFRWPKFCENKRFLYIVENQQHTEKLIIWEKQTANFTWPNWRFQARKSTVYSLANRRFALLKLSTSACQTVDLLWASFQNKSLLSPFCHPDITRKG